MTSQSKVMVQNVSDRSFFTFHDHFEGKSVPWTLKSRVFQVSALTSMALKKKSIASEGATAALETLLRIIWICESKRKGRMTSQSKVMVQNVSDRSFFTFHAHCEGKNVPWTLKSRVFWSECTVMEIFRPGARADHPNLKIGPGPGPGPTTQNSKSARAPGPGRPLKTQNRPGPRARADHPKLKFGPGLIF